MNILYGINGEGKGHALRSKPIIDYLRKKHNVTVICGGSAYNTLSKYNPIEIEALRFVYKDGKIKNAKTLISNITKTPKFIKDYFKIKKTILKNKINLIITDFEPITAYSAIMNKIYLISIDNQHAITRLNLTHKSKFITKALVKAIVPKADKYLITTFINYEIKDKCLKDTVLIPPILRKEIVNSKVREKDYFLVYTSTPDENIISVLKKRKEKFILYGFGKGGKEENLEFKEINEKEFIKDMSSSQGVISGGGSTTISEAVFLKKPLLIIPLNGQEEQKINAKFISENGWGIYAKKLTEEELEKYITNLKTFKKNLQRKTEYNQNKIYLEINKIINKI